MIVISIISILIALASLICIVLVYLGVKKLSSDMLRELGHVDALMPDEKVPGTDWVYCSGECSIVTRPNNRMKCRPDTCTGTDCSCQIFRRPRPIPEDWDGKYEHVGDGDQETEKEAGYAYMCWCVKPAA